MDDDRTVVGLDDPQGEEEKLMNILSDRLEPRPTVQVRHASHDGHDVLLVSLAFQAGPIHLKSKPLEEGTYGRYGSTSRVVDAGRLAELRRYRESRTWDELPCSGATRADLDEGLAEHIFDQRNARYSDAMLRTCRLLVDHGGELVPSNAGIVLFGRDRAKHFLDDARWRCIRYPGTTKGTEAFDARDFRTERCWRRSHFWSRMSANTAAATRGIAGLDRNETPAFSERVVREVLVNAIAHANYEVTGCRLDVSLYADRVEVQSPGTWPPGYQMDDLKDGVSQVRNRAIARTLRILRYMEEQGTAWARVQEAVSDGFPEPRWELHGPVLRVVMAKHPFLSVSPDADGNSGETERTGETGKSLDGRGAAARRRREHILAVLRARAPQDVAIAELPQLIDSSLTSTYRDVDALRREGVVRDTTRGRIAASERS